MQNSSFRVLSPAAIFFGNGCSKQIGPVAKTMMGVDKAVIFCDKDIFNSGLLKGIEASLTGFDVAYDIYSEVVPNPTHSSIMKAAQFIIDAKADIVIAVGGGSSMDTAKVARAMTVAPPPISQYVDVEGAIKGRPIPQISVPTTAGTGAEATAGGVVADDNTHIKGIVSGLHLMAMGAFVDPELTISLPPRLTASTGMDALTHAIEGCSSQFRNPVADLYHFEAIRLIAANLRTAYADGKDINARYNMLLGATLAGLAVGSTSCGAAHGFAYPLESDWRISHGEANAAMLPAVMRHNAPAVAPIYRKVAELMGENVAGLSDRAAAMVAVDAVQQLAADVHIPTLAEHGITEKDVEDLAITVMSMTRALGNNTTFVTMYDAKKIYTEALGTTVSTKDGAGKADEEDEEDY